MNDTDRDVTMVRFLMRFCTRLFCYLAVLLVALLFFASFLYANLDYMLDRASVCLILLLIGWLAYFTTAVFWRLDKIEQRLAKMDKDTAD